MISVHSSYKSLVVPQTLHSWDQTLEPTSDQVQMDQVDLGQCMYTTKGRPNATRSYLLVLSIEVPHVSLQMKIYPLLPSQARWALRFPSQHSLTYF